jgi:hypothetical protein
MTAVSRSPTTCDPGRARRVLRPDRQRRVVPEAGADQVAGRVGDAELAEPRVGVLGPVEDRRRRVAGVVGDQPAEHRVGVPEQPVRPAGGRRHHPGQVVAGAVDGPVAGHPGEGGHG